MDLAHPQESQRPLCRARTLNSADSLPSLCVLGGPGSLQASVQQRPTQCHQCNEVGKEASHHPMACAGAREGVLGSTWKVSPKWEHVFYVSLSSYVHKGDEGTQALGNGASRGAGETERRPGFPTALQLTQSPALLTHLHFPDSGAGSCSLNVRMAKVWQRGVIFAKTEWTSSIHMCHSLTLGFSPLECPSILMTDTSGHLISRTAT